jgi:hypothetical protein
MLPLIAALAMQPDFLVPDGSLDSVAGEVAKSAHTKYPKLKDDELAFAVGRIDRSKKEISFGQFQGSMAFYPASTVKLFYLGYGAYLLDHKKLILTPELERGFTDMIVDSVNDATALVLDSITGTTGGPELSEPDLNKWLTKRGAVNRWLVANGFTGINANQKTWNEGPYGRERQGYGPKFERRNSLTPISGVRMMGMIALDRIAGPERSAWMKKLLDRKIPADSKEADFQSKAFTGGVLPSGTQLWSKAGYTDTARLDIATFKLPNGHEYIFAIFTKGQSNEPSLIPFVARGLLQKLGEATAPEQPPSEERKEN